MQVMEKKHHRGLRLFSPHVPSSLEVGHPMQVQQSRDVLRVPGLSCHSVPIPGGQLSILMLVTSWLPGNCWSSVLTTESQGKKKWGESPCTREGTTFPRRSVLTHLGKLGRLSPHT